MLYIGHIVVDTAWLFLFVYNIYMICFSEDYDFDLVEFQSSLHVEDALYLEDLHHMDNRH